MIKENRLSSTTSTMIPTPIKRLLLRRRLPPRPGPSSYITTSLSSHQTQSQNQNVYMHIYPRRRLCAYHFRCIYYHCHLIVMFIYPNASTATYRCNPASASQTTAFLKDSQSAKVHQTPVHTLLNQPTYLSEWKFYPFINYQPTNHSFTHSQNHQALYLTTGGFH